MLSPDSLVTKVPTTPPAQISLQAATGLLAVLAVSRDTPSLLQRLAIQDDVVRTDALLVLLDDIKGLLSPELLAMSMHMASRSAALRQKLLPYLIRTFRFDAVQKLMQAEAQSASQESKWRLELMQATMRNAYAEQVRLHECLYLQTGNATHLLTAFEISCERLGWREALPVFLRNVWVQTKPIQGLSLSYLKMLEREDAREEFKTLGRVLVQIKSASLCHVFVAAQSMLWDKEYTKCIQLLERSKAIEATSRETALFTNLAANAAEKTGDYLLAARYYQQQNETLKAQAPAPDLYIKDLKYRASMSIGVLPKDQHTHHVIMTGFPRSGTTLLENILASHPQLETCEETSSLVSSLATAYRTPMKNDPTCENLTLRAAQHRRLYYQNLQRFVHKPGATVIIDKTPIMSSNIKYLEKLFPEKRYVFSIRHPYDVVLSNFKQDYAQNRAMSAFNDMRTACILYNHTMSDWFEVFPGETPRVHFVKYDELVTDFERVVNGVLAFLGVAWTDEVRRFAEHSAQRAVRTPSYGKVRQGLGIGVQSSWQNFEFLFDDECRSLLDPWVRRFGYA